MITFEVIAAPLCTIAVEGLLFTARSMCYLAYMQTPVLDKIRDFLTRSGVTFTERQHQPTLTSAESAQARGEELSTGAKALLLKTDDQFTLFVLPADCRPNSNLVRQYLNVKRTRFASVQELQDLTGLVSGAVPPFGEPILPFKLYADFGVGKKSGRVAFNAGSLTNSIIMATNDWERISSAEHFSFAEMP